MGATITCDRCPTIVRDVLCPDHAELKCDSCKRVSDELLCSDCAEDEYGNDGTVEPDEDDVIALIEHAVISDDVGDLGAAIRRGDLSEAEYLLDKIAAAVPGWTDRVSIGRYSFRARAA